MLGVAHGLLIALLSGLIGAQGGALGSEPNTRVAVIEQGAIPVPDGGGRALFIRPNLVHLLAPDGTPMAYVLFASDRSMLQVGHLGKEPEIVGQWPVAHQIQVDGHTATVLNFLDAFLQDGDVLLAFWSTAATDALKDDAVLLCRVTGDTESGLAPVKAIPLLGNRGRLPFSSGLLPVGTGSARDTTLDRMLPTPSGYVVVGTHEKVSSPFLFGADPIHHLFAMGCSENSGERQFYKPPQKRVASAWRYDARLAEDGTLHAAWIVEHVTSDSSANYQDVCYSRLVGGDWSRPVRLARIHKTDEVSYGPPFLVRDVSLAVREDRVLVAWDELAVGLRYRLYDGEDWGDTVDLGGGLEGYPAAGIVNDDVGRVVGASFAKDGTMYLLQSRPERTRVLRCAGNDSWQSADIDVGPAERWGVTAEIAASDLVALDSDEATALVARDLAGDTMLFYQRVRFPRPTGRVLRGVAHAEPAPSIDEMGLALWLSEWVAEWMGAATTLALAGVCCYLLYRHGKLPRLRRR